jgi:cob(I)alamin adenosyltransferase
VAQATNWKGLIVRRIYTRTGDDGTTGLIGGTRVTKDSPRIEAYGTVDELNAVLGFIRSYPLPTHLDRTLEHIQDDLFTVGANLALSEEEAGAASRIPELAETAVAALEESIDEHERTLEPLARFILPGGASQAALLHFARTVARRAERCCVRLAHLERVDPRILRYLNRLSDLLFVLARFVNHRESRPERHPTFGKRDRD